MDQQRDKDFTLQLEDDQEKKDDQNSPLLKSIGKST